MSGGLNIAVVGATGALGREILTVMEDIGLKYGRLSLFASPASVGTELLVQNRVLTVADVATAYWQDFDAVVFAATPEVHRAHMDAAGATGCVIIERYLPEAGRDDGVWTVISDNDKGVDTQCFRSAPGAVVALAPILGPLQAAFGLAELHVTCMEPASEAGQRGMEQLSNEVLNLYKSGSVEGKEEDEPAPESPFDFQMAFNAIPQVGDVNEAGVSQLEVDIMESLDSTLGKIPVKAVTAIRMPWFSSHALDISVKLKKDASVEAIRSLLAEAPRIDLRDNPQDGILPMPFDAIGQDDVHMGRLRSIDESNRRFSFFCVADNLRLASASNLVAVLQLLSDVKK